MGSKIQDETELIISVVKKYYEMGMTQDQISSEEFISKSTVSRLLKKAVESGIVSFQLNSPLNSIVDIKKGFKEEFDFDNVHLAPTFTDNPETKLRDTCRIVAKDLCDIIRPDDTLGVGWGSHIEQLANIFSSEIVLKRKCSKVVLLNGSVASNTNSTKSSYIVRELADFFSADGYIMPVPLIVDNEETAGRIRNDSHISYVFDYGREARIAVFSIGDTSLESVLRTRGAYTDEDYDIVLSKGAVGNILGHCYKFSGIPVKSSVNGRIIGITLDELKNKEYRIGIGIGVQKAKAIIGALRSRIINHLYTDSDTAKEVLRIYRSVR